MSHTLKLDSPRTEILAPVGRIVDESGHNSQNPSPESMSVIAILRQPVVALGSRPALTLAYRAALGTYFHTVPQPPLPPSKVVPCYAERAFLLLLLEADPR
jgi:hypothetical protein